MIDWLTIQAPMVHPAPISAGFVQSVSEAGEVEWQTIKRRSLLGSWESSLQVRTCAHTLDRCSHIEVSGNPVKWFQGHNLWGTDDVASLVVATLDQVAYLLAIAVDEATRAAWRAGGDIKLTRVDITESFHLRSKADVLAWIRAARQSARLPRRGGDGVMRGDTLYFRKHSRRWSLKLYSKGQEVRVKGHGQGAVLGVPEALEWADRSLRAELTLRSLELKRRGLGTVGAWLAREGVSSDASMTHDMLSETLGSMTMTTLSALPEAVLAGLTNGQRTAYLAWRAGSDLRAILPKNSFYRLRRKLLPHGIDVAIVQSSEPTNVVPLRRVLEAVPVGVPDWARGTQLYFEPRRIA